MGEKQQPESEQPLHSTEHNDAANDPLLDRSASSFYSPSPLSSPDASGHAPQWSMMSSSSHFTNNAQIPFPEHENYNDYDPNRIPSSVFSSDPSAPTDWSSASNESLFSIHGGNASFSRDFELMNDRTLSPLTEVSADHHHEGKSGNLMNQVNDVSPKLQMEKGSEEKSSCGRNSYVQDTAGTPQTEHIPLSPARISNASGNSCKSFAFPVLVKETSSKPGSQPQHVERKSESQSQPEQPPEPETEAKSQTPKAAEYSWCTCFCCWSRCW